MNPLAAAALFALTFVVIPVQSLIPKSAGDERIVTTALNSPGVLESTQPTNAASLFVANERYLLNRRNVRGGRMAWHITRMAAGRLRERACLVSSGLAAV